MTRSEAWDLLCEYTKSENLRRHALAVEAAMKGYAAEGGEDVELWSVVGLLHDFDYEIHPTMDKHPQDGAPILRERGVSEETIDAIQAHAPHTGVARDTSLKRTLFAVDELTGLLVACALVRPGKTLEGLKVSSVKKKMKQKSFAAAVNRDEIRQGAEELGVALEDHIATVVGFLHAVQTDLGLGDAAG